MQRFLSCLILFGITVFYSCGPATQVENDTTVDLSARWNDTDSLIVAENMVSDCLTHIWLGNHFQTTGAKPVVVFGVIRNKTEEPIAIPTIVSYIEKGFINSGKVRVVASGSERDEIRGKRAAQHEKVAIETIKRMGRELGADYMMTGEINTIEDYEEGHQIVFYQTDLALIDIESNKKSLVRNIKNQEIHWKTEVQNVEHSSRHTPCTVNREP